MNSSFASLRQRLRNALSYALAVLLLAAPLALDKGLVLSEYGTPVGYQFNPLGEP